MPRRGEAYSSSAAPTGLGARNGGKGLRRARSPRSPRSPRSARSPRSPCLLRRGCEGCAAGSPAAASPCLCVQPGVPNSSLVFTNKPKAPAVIYSRCCLRHLPGEFDPAMFLTYFCTYLDRMLRPSKVSLY